MTTATLLPTVPLQMSTTGGSATVVVLALAALALATVLSIVVALRLYRGYRAGGNRDMLLLLIGLVMLTTAPILLRLVLTNVPGTSTTTRAIAASASQLCGLLLILEVVYVRR